MSAERTNHRCDEGGLQRIEVITDGGAADFTWGRESRRFKPSATLRHQPLWKRFIGAVNAYSRPTSATSTS
jgi:hypothetical protein